MGWDHDTWKEMGINPNLKNDNWNGVKMNKTQELERKEFSILPVDKLERLIRRVCGVDYEIVPEEELHNGYTPVWGLKGINQFLNIEKFKNGDKWAMGHTKFMEHLVFMGFLNPGNYLIDHTW